MLITSVGISTSIADQQYSNTRYELEGERYQLLSAINNEGKTIIIVTHDKNIASYCKRNILLTDGKIVEDTPSIVSNVNN